MNLVNGYYTSVFGNAKHITFKIEIGKKRSLKGKRIIGYMVGTSNTGPYEPFGFVHGNFINVFNTFRAQQPADLVSRVEAGLKILKGDFFAAGKAYAVRYRNCFVCNRELTNPESVEAGIGPECLKRTGR